MWCFSDDPEFFRRHFPVSEPTAGQPPPTARDAWTHLVSPEPPSIVARVGDDDDHVLIHVRDTPRSLYQTIRSTLGDGIDLPPLLATLAEGGKGLRGNRVRSWSALPGNLHLSVLIRHRLPVSTTGAGLSMLPAVVLADWLTDRLPPEHPPEIKWVNDLLLHGRKIGGVLASSAIRGNEFDDCLFGIGLNLHVAPLLEPDVFVPGTACLAEWMPPPPLGTVAMEILDRIQRSFELLATEGFPPLLERYRHHCRAIGRPVRVWADEPGDPSSRKPLARGILRSIGPDLRLQIEGHPGPIHHGRMAFEEDASAFENSRFPARISD